MPKGRHKGGRRQFTDFDAEAERKEREEKQASWRARRGELPSDESGEEKGSGSEKESESESESSSSEESETEAKVIKPKGVSGLIELENPNRVGAKAARKVTELDGAVADAGTSAKPQLSRREREELEKQKATAHYRKLHAQGKTDEARADLERLALVRARREEAEMKKKEQQQAKDAAVAAKSASLPGKKKT